MYTAEKIQTGLSLLHPQVAEIILDTFKKCNTLQEMTCILEKCSEVLIEKHKYVTGKISSVKNIEMIENGGNYISSNLTLNVDEKNEIGLNKEDKIQVNNLSLSDINDNSCIERTEKSLSSCIIIKELYNSRSGLLALKLHSSQITLDLGKSNQNLLQLVYNTQLLTDLLKPSTALSYFDSRIGKPIDWINSTSNTIAQANPWKFSVGVPGLVINKCTIQPRLPSTLLLASYPEFSYLSDPGPLLSAIDAILSCPVAYKLLNLDCHKSRDNLITFSLFYHTRSLFPKLIPTDELLLLFPSIRRQNKTFIISIFEWMTNTHSNWYLLRPFGGVEAILSGFQNSLQINKVQKITKTTILRRIQLTSWLIDVAISRANCSLDGARLCELGSYLGPPPVLEDNVVNELVDLSDKNIITDYIEPDWLRLWIGTASQLGASAVAQAQSSTNLTILWKEPHVFQKVGILSTHIPIARLPCGENIALLWASLVLPVSIWKRCWSTRYHAKIGISPVYMLRSGVQERHILTVLKLLSLCNSIDPESTFQLLINHDLYIAAVTILDDNRGLGLQPIISGLGVGHEKNKIDIDNCSILVENIKSKVNEDNSTDQDTILSLVTEYESNVSYTLLSEIQKWYENKSNSIDRAKSIDIAKKICGIDFKGSFDGPSVIITEMAKPVREIKDMNIAVNQLFNKIVHCEATLDNSLDRIRAIRF